MKRVLIGLALFMAALITPTPVSVHAYGPCPGVELYVQLIRGPDGVYRESGYVDGNLRRVYLSGNTGAVQDINVYATYPWKIDRVLIYKGATGQTFDVDTNYFFRQSSNTTKAVGCFYSVL